MSKLNLMTPLTFEPIFMERMWGGRRLEAEFGKKMPPQRPIGESWEIVDRTEDQSIVRNGLLRGKTLHELWNTYRDETIREATDSSPFRLLLHHNLFEIQKWNLDSPREIAPRGQFAIACCLTGSLRSAGVDLARGEFFLIPGQLQDRQLYPRTEGTSLLRVTIP